MLNTQALAPDTNINVRQDSFWLPIIYLTSALIVGAVAFLILGPRPAGLEGRLDVSALPTLNAALNATTTLLLLFGFACIKRRKLTLHRRAMLSAFATSAMFLVSYVIYHGFKSCPRLYTGTWKLLYGTVLLSHIVLAVVILPLALMTLYRGFNMQTTRHRAMARVTLPLWLYVSVTGVVIYWLLYL